MKLEAAELASAGCVRVGRRILCLGEASSTNDAAFEALEREGLAADGFVVFAERQTAGRGSRGRSWRAREGRGLLFSLALRAEAPPPAPALVAAAAVAIRETAASAGVATRIKWPNDLLAGGRKLCGILVEARTRPGQAHLVVGIGLNVNDDPARDFDAALAATATSLGAEAGRALDRAAVARTALDALDRWIPAAFARERGALERAFVEGLGLAGAPVRLERAGDPIVGNLLAVDLRAGLTLATAAGTVTVPCEHVTSLSPLRPD